MHLAPRDLDKLLLHNAGFLAQKRLARGCRLNYPEAVALIAAQLLEFIRDGWSAAEVTEGGRQLLGHAQLMDGVGTMIHEVQVEGTFRDGTKLVTVHQPIAREHGDLVLALHGSFLPVPSKRLFRGTTDTTHGEPGEITVMEGELVLNEGRPTGTISVKNRGDRPIQVGSHYPFDETNSALEFHRAQAAGMRLDIPSGTAVRFEPGDEKTVRLVRRSP